MIKINNDRLKEFQQVLAKKGLDGYVLTRPIDQGFLTGYDLEGYTLLVTKKKAYAFLVKMLVDQFKSNFPYCETEGTADINKALLAKAEKLGLKKVGFDADTEFYSRGKLWRKHGFKETPSLIVPLRETKKGMELARVKKACQIAVAALAKVKKNFKPGRTELSMALEIEHMMEKMGATAPSFSTIIGSGPNSSRPHHCSSHRKLKNNEVLLVDFGCIFEHYCSDMTRTWFVGKKVPSHFKKIYSIVEESQRLGLKATKAGVKTKQVDKFCRDYIAKQGYGKYFIHGTGHGLGLEIHESPRLADYSKATLREGMTVTVEPGIYFEGKFGIRLEETVVVKKNGCEILTK
jgi:Xaa-Pro aminopeptidase